MKNQYIKKIKSGTIKKIFEGLEWLKKNFPLSKILPEFVFILVAVFLGLYFNDLREDNQESRKAHEFAIQLYKDLDSESKLIQEKIEFRKLKDIYADSLFLLFKNPNFANNSNLIHFYHRSTSRRAFISSANPTIEQLKNTGELKLFKSTKIIGEIFSYDIQRRDIEQLQQIEEQILFDFRRLAPKILDADILENMVPDIEVKKSVKKSLLITEDKEIINEICVNLHYINSANKRLLKYLVDLKIQCDKLKNITYKEFNLNKKEINNY